MNINQVKFHTLTKDTDNKEHKITRINMYKAINLICISNSTKNWLRRPGAEDMENKTSNKTKILTYE